ncbi:antibiotic biosynthesis monooxygenase [Endozoicomonas sp. SM1973]|uniref:Antibiotic biosynthesis monooxygenase n=1 Tax=Spartinivicinus marinus TaxID=2994442 RepID=A0A853HZA8_9GAMM|nr:antibiotic biosynthesis monooxygenase [Spartinivicinus marinus]MCX4024834.1 antibiotic biosynthesis monooxygenase [Spartinivicinus marinus]NYZ66523.1 antibiotic biosynthesis monooxygenase [Spartinivicinus marinus]
MSEFIEIFRFKLKAGATQTELETANQTLQQFIQQQSGFLYRSLSFNNVTHEWLSINYWESEAAAQAVANQFMESQLTQAYMAIVDNNTINKELSTVVACQAGSSCGES